VWDAVTGKVINTLTGHSHAVFSVSFSPDGSRICSGSRDDTIRVWGVEKVVKQKIYEYFYNVKSKTYDNEGNEGNDDNVI
jgi:WD40 repeat protein